jgi:NADPH2:quinone reductase
LAHHLRCVKFQNEQINWEKASSIQGSLQTMHDAIITNGKFKKGQSIFIQGASSGVGLIGLQIGKCLGASLIFGSSSDQTRLKKLSKFGADHLVDISKSNWKNIILDKTNGKGVDLVIDMLSGNFSNLNMEVTKINGHLINIGRLAGMNSNFDHDLHAKRRVHYIGTTGRTRSIEENYLVSKLANDELWKFVLNDQIKHPIDSVFELTDAELALNRMNDNKHFGKIILKT